MNVVVVLLMFMVAASATVEVFPAYQEDKLGDITTIYRLDEPPLFITDDSLGGFYRLEKNDTWSGRYMEVHARTNAIGAMLGLPQDVVGPSLGDNLLDLSRKWTKTGWLEITGGIPYPAPRGWPISMLSPEGNLLETRSKPEPKFSISSCRLNIDTDSRIIRSHSEYGRSTYSNHMNAECHLELPPGYRIAITVDDLQLESCCDFVTIFDESNVPIVRLVASNKPSNPVVSQGRRVRILFTTDSSATFRGFQLRYSVHDDRRSLELPTSALTGELRSPLFVPNSGSMCVSVVCLATGSDDATLDVSIRTFLGQNTDLGTVDLAEKPRNTWWTYRFRAPLTPDTRHQLSTVVLRANKTSNSTIAVGSISLCSEDEGTTMFVIGSEPINRLNNTYLVKTQNPPATPNQLSCGNGGLFNDSYSRCVCPPGFTGTHCSIACGPNRFGDDCGGVCSAFARGCSGLLMCRFGWGCACAPGFTGPRCSDRCEHGWYGASCAQRCGDCIPGESCDPHRGVCVRGCRDGSYPPFCQLKYAHYIKPPTVVSTNYREISLLVDNRPTNIEGGGDPRYYQLQYKSDNQWQSTTYRLLPEEDQFTYNLTSLIPGTEYRVMIDLVAADGGRYNHSNEVAVRTRCDAPQDSSYLQLWHTEPNADRATLHWNFTATGDNLCPVSWFEVYVLDDWRWLPVYNVTDTEVTIGLLAPAMGHKVAVRAVYVTGEALLSEMYIIKDTNNGPVAVTNLAVEATTFDGMTLRWNGPDLPTGRADHYYLVAYQCVKHVACKDDEGCQSGGEVRVKTSSVTLHGLVPHTLYRVTVTPYPGSEGNPMELYAVTNYTVPAVAPSAAEAPFTDRTNTSFTAHWAPPADCVLLHGFLQSYRYELRAAGKADILATGQTDLTSVTLDGLEAYVRYVVSVYAKTAAGWSPGHALQVEAITRATPPGPVQQLTVYKRSRRMMGLRWAPPRDPNGPITSFTVTYWAAGTGDRECNVVLPEPCPAWPDLFCHSLSGLQSDTVYSVQVQARNSEVDEDGLPAVVVAMSSESAPGPPRNLRLVGRTQSSILVQWELPDMINGVLRTFLVSVEESDTLNVSDCCQDFPMQRLSVMDEQMMYSLEVVGLRPASTYTVSVNAKTMTIGPGATITAVTHPPVPPPPRALEVFQPAPGLPLSVSLMLPERVDGLRRDFLILLLPYNETLVPAIDIHDSDLKQWLTAVTPRSFYVARQLSEEEAASDVVQILLGTGAGPFEGSYSTIVDPRLVPGELYSVGVVHISWYSSLANWGYAQSDGILIALENA